MFDLLFPKLVVLFVRNVIYLSVSWDELNYVIHVPHVLVFQIQGGRGDIRSVNISKCSPTI